MIGAPPRAVVRVVFNGISQAEIEPVMPGANAADLVSVGEFRHIKGTDVLIDALAELHRSGRRLTLAVAGDGVEGPTLREQVTRLGLADSVRFLGHTPPRTAFAQGRMLVMPSRADSLPYVAIEAGGAKIPIVASEVGGIPEILGSDGNMVPPEDPTRLAHAIAAAIDDPPGAQARAAKLHERIRSHFSQDAMVEGVLAGYRDALGAKFTQSH
jgi:glycosyltransferase involved in cell wall biosynthesis